MTTSPSVSVCIPTYDRRSWLQLALESVLAQASPALEVVVSDNHGNAREVVERLADTRIRYFANKTNLGPAGNTNAALDLATGELRGVLHDDDRLLPGYLEQVLAVFRADPTIGVVFTDHLFESDKGLRHRARRLAGGRYSDPLPMLLEHKPIAMSAMMMRREVWEAVRPLPDLLTMDYVLYFRAALAAWPFFYLAKPLMVSRVHAGQLSNDFRLRHDDVALWESFTFPDARCEQVRRRKLADALISRASGEVRLARCDEARRDLARAADLAPHRLRPRARLLTLLAHFPRVARLAAAARGLPSGS